MPTSINNAPIDQAPVANGLHCTDDMRQFLYVRFVDMLVFTIPMLSFLEIRLIGRLFVSDIILAGLFPFMLIAKAQRPIKKMPFLFLFFCVLWLFGQVTTDLIRHTPFADYSRGWAKISFTLINFSVLYLILHSNRRRIVLYALGIAVGGILGYFFNPGIYAEGSPWKFGIGSSATCLMVLISTGFFERIKLVSISILGFAALINLYLGYRSLAGICFLTMTYMMLQWLYSQKSALRNDFSLKKKVFVGLVIMFMGFIFINGYEYVAQKGILGEKNLQKYESQASGNLGILIGGRSEILVSVYAIRDSPIIGHGSWAKDHRYADMLMYLKSVLGYTSAEPGEEGLIPSHSHIFGAWVEAGILGAVFWIWVLSLPIRVLTGSYRTKEPLSPLIIFFSFILIWDILFSPYGAERRFITPYYIIVMMSFLTSVISKNRGVRSPHGA